VIWNIENIRTIIKLGEKPGTQLRKGTAFLSKEKKDQNYEKSFGVQCWWIYRWAFGKKLKREGYWVRGVDIKEHEFATTQADEFLLLDLREKQNCKSALTLSDGAFDEVYQLAADMGGMGFRLSRKSTPCFIALCPMLKKLD
jgi:hypothetical protein